MSLLASDKFWPRILTAGHYASSAHVPPHRHDGEELLFITEGRCDFAVGGNRLKGEPGTLFLLPAGIPHSQHSYGFVRTSFVVLRANESIMPDASRLPLTFKVDLTAAPARWMEDICTPPTVAGTDPPSDDVRIGLAKALLSHLNALASTEPHRDNEHPALKAALAFLKTYPVSLASPSATEIARHACVSVSHLNTLFCKRVGCGPVEYHLRLRLEYAELLLRNPAMTIQQIARACGFTDTNYFVRLFRQRHGVPPGSWRRGINSF